MEKAVTPYHIPALLSETIELLDINPSGVYVDATFGGGGHSRAILDRLGPRGHLYGFDRDIDALANAPEDPRFTFVHSDFRFMTNFMRYYGVRQVDGILADLGVSFHHFDTAQRGFSFRMEGPLDMRMNPLAPRQAKDILAEISEQDLRELLKRHTDLRNTPAVARKICEARRDNPIELTTQLAEVLEGVLDPRNLKKEMAQVFQALRIATNDEFGALRQLLSQSQKLLKKGGRLAILTYHSGEDRMVKDFLKNGGEEKADNADLIFGKKKSPWKLITRTPVTASESEVEQNPRSRSAKLRVAEKI